jgi:nitrite reductase (NO-forming)
MGTSPWNLVAGAGAAVLALAVILLVAATQQNAVAPPATPAAGEAMLAHPVHAAGAEDPADIVADPTAVPKPIGTRMPRRMRVELETVELTGKLSDGATFRYWTFNRQVPGPFIRVRAGDTVEVRLKNHESSKLFHNVDFHAVTGPGGGGAVTEAAPGEARGFEFLAKHPGLFIYHCAVPVAAQHLANGMYGLILVEPEGGLEPVDHEFYVVQGELYTEGAFGAQGPQRESFEKLIEERPDYFVFNGAVGALSSQKPLAAQVGDTVRIYFGNGGPNKVASFHVIGEVFDRAYDLASLTTPPKRDVQTVLVPPGGATVVEFAVDVPGRFILADHALSRLERGLVGILTVEGAQNVTIFRDLDPERTSRAMGH